jgi:ABC-type molybdate transport system permease subunit
MNWLSATLSLLATIAALVAANYWREASKVYGEIDQKWMGKLTIPDSVSSFAALDAVKDSGTLNLRAAYWTGASAIFSFAAAIATLWFATSN